VAAHGLPASAHRPTVCIFCAVNFTCHFPPFSIAGCLITPAMHRHSRSVAHPPVATVQRSIENRVASGWLFAYRATIFSPLEYRHYRGNGATSNYELGTLAVDGWAVTFGTVLGSLLLLLYITTLLGTFNPIFICLQTIVSCSILLDLNMTPVSCKMIYLLNLNGQKLGRWGLILRSAT